MVLMVLMVRCCWGTETRARTPEQYSPMKKIRVKLSDFYPIRPNESPLVTLARKMMLEGYTPEIRAEYHRLIAQEKKETAPPSPAPTRRKP